MMNLKENICNSNTLEIDGYSNYQLKRTLIVHSLEISSNKGNRIVQVQLFLKKKRKFTPERAVTTRQSLSDSLLRLWNRNSPPLSTPFSETLTLIFKSRRFSFWAATIEGGDGRDLGGEDLRGRDWGTPGGGGLGCFRDSGVSRRGWPGGG